MFSSLTIIQLKICGEAKDGAEAVERAKETKPDVVILNITMPVLNGFDAARGGIRSRAFHVWSSVTVGPIFHPRVLFRPNADFAFGEVTDMIAINLDREISFGNFDYETGFNVLAGMQSRRGTFVELKTSLWSRPGPTLRVIVG